MVFSEVGQPEVKIPAVDQMKRELDPRFPTYDVNVQPGLGSRSWGGRNSFNASFSGLPHSSCESGPWVIFTKSQSETK